MFGTQLPFQAGEIVANVKHAAIFGASILGAVSGEMFSAASAFEVGNSHRVKDNIQWSPIESGEAGSDDSYLRDFIRKIETTTKTKPPARRRAKAKKLFPREA